MYSNPRFKLDLTRRLALLTVALPLSLGAAQLAFDFYLQQRAAGRDAAERAEFMAAQLAPLAGVFLGEGRIGELEKALKHGLVVDGVLSVRVLDADQKPIAEVNKDTQSGSHSASAADQSSPASAPAAKDVIRFGADLRDMPGVRLQLDFSQPPMTVELTLLRFLSLACGLGFALLCGGLAQRHLTRLSILLKQLTRSADAAATGRFGHRVPLQTADDLLGLTVAFNRMLIQLDRTMISRDYIDNILRSMSEALIVLDPFHCIKTVNPAACHMLGYEESELLGRPFETIMGPQGLPPRRDLLTRLEQHGQLSQYDTYYVDKHGKAVAVLFSGSIMRDASGERSGIVCLAQDNRARKLREQKVEQLAYFDSLTGLPNRVQFRQHLAKCLAVATDLRHRLAILFLDLNGFKRINDTYGHASGDLLLRLVAARLRRTVRADDYTTRLAKYRRPCLARLGGDEFTIMLPVIDSASQAAAVARRILNVMQLPFDLGKDIVTISTSIGIALYPDHGSDLASLLRMADSAMYRAKETGYPCYNLCARPAEVNQRMSCDPAIDHELALCMAG